MPDYRQVVFNQLLADMRRFLERITPAMLEDRHMIKLHDDLKVAIMFAQSQLEEFPDEYE